MNKYGLLYYPGTENLGDEIQSLAAKQYLPRVDRFFNRENLRDIGDERETDLYKIFMNGWFCHHPENWPPHSNLKPLLTSVHISREPTEFGPSAAEVLLQGPNLEYLYRHSPVGCRDLATLELLQDYDIPSYFSGCLTLTLKRKSRRRDRDIIVTCDVSSEIVEAMTKMTDKHILSVSHTPRTGATSYERFLQANALLDLYAKCSCVITSRLHCAMPCLAFNTPVLFVGQPGDAYRIKGLRELLHCADEFTILDGSCEFDFNHPPGNNDKHKVLGQELTRRAITFISS